MTKEQFLSNVPAVMSTSLYGAQDVEVTLLSSNVQTVALKDQTSRGIELWQKQLLHLN